MTDKIFPWSGDFRLGGAGPINPDEEAFLRDAERIAEEVAGMSDADVADYLVEHGLQELVAPDRVDALLASALEGARQRQEGAAPDETGELPGFAVRNTRRGDNDPQAHEKLAAGGNVFRPNFGARRDPTR